MKLTQSNYFSPEAMTKYMSTSQFKTFEECPARAIAEMKEEFKTDKECFKEGHFFEALITGEDELFLMQNPDMVSSRGATKGNAKSNFQKVIASAETFKNQKMFMDIVNKSKQQVIVKGIIAGVEFKGCIDFLCEDFSAYDTKNVKDFKKIYSESDGHKVEWFFAYGYHYQSAIYRELILQTFGKVGNLGILAASKEEVPDVDAFIFSSDILNNAIEIVKEFAPLYDKMKKGTANAPRCEKCNYCKSTKVINEFREIEEFE